MALDLNVKSIQPIKGLTVYEVAPALHNVIVASGTLKAGDFVKLNTLSIKSKLTKISNLFFVLLNKN